MSQGEWGAGPAGRAGRREWVGLAVIALPCVLYAMDFTVLNLAVPSLGAALRPSSAQLLWIVDVYGFVLAPLLIPMGTLGDRIGRRRLLLIGAAAFGAASVFAAFARSAAMLIAARAVLGVAGATLAPSTLSLIRNMFLDADERRRAVGVWVTSFSTGGAIGPLVGGALLERFWWGSVFLVGVPVMILLLAVGPRLLPEYRDPAAGRVDVASVAMSLATVLLVIYGLKRIALSSYSTLPAAAVVAGGALGVLFVRRQRTLADPVVDLRLFRSVTFSAALVSYAVATLVVLGTYLFEVQYLQLVKGLSPLATALVTLPMFAAFIVGAMATPSLTRNARPTTLMMGGFLLSSAGLGVLAVVGVATPLAVIVVGGAIYALGLSPVSTLATDLMIGAAPPERAGVASALSESASELGGALGIALLGTVGTAVYRAAMLRVVPRGVPADLAEAARNTLGGAIAAAGQLPGTTGVELSAGARDAFSGALNVVALICVVAILTTALGVFVALRRAEAGSSAATPCGAVLAAGD